MSTLKVSSVIGEGEVLAVTVTYFLCSPLCWPLLSNFALITPSSPGA